MLTIDDLPDEIIVIVFSYLSLSDRKQSRLVCKRWLDLSYTTSLTKEDIIVLKKNCCLEKCNLQTKHWNIRIESLESVNNLIFWKQHGVKVKSLEIFLASLVCPVLYDILHHCPNLEFLTLSSRDKNELSRYVYLDVHYDPPSISLPNLVSLDFLFMLDLTCPLFGKFTARVPKLKRIGFGFKNFLSSEMKCMYIQNDILTLIHRQSLTLKELYFSRCAFLNDDALRHFLEVVGPQLSGLYVPGCLLQTDRILLTIARRVPNLTELDLSFDLLLPDSGLISMLPSLVKLKRISLRKTHIGDRVINSLTKLKALEGIDLTHCKSLTGDGISLAFGNSLLERLIDLRLSNINQITDDVLKVISPQLSKLKYLYLDNCCRITTAGVRAVADSCTYLRCLSLQNCKKLQDLSVIGLNRLKGLIHLDLYGCKAVANKSVGQLQFVELRTIDISDINFHESSLFSLIANCPSLQRVHMSEGADEDIDLSKIVRKPGSEYPILAFGYCPFEGESIFD